MRVPRRGDWPAESVGALAGPAARGLYPAVEDLGASYYVRVRAVFVIPIDSDSCNLPLPPPRDITRHAALAK